MTRRTVALGGLATAALLALGGTLWSSLAATTADGEDPLWFVDPELRPSARALLKMAATSPPLSAETIKAAQAGWGGTVPAPLADVPYRQQAIPGAPGDPAVKIYVVNARPGSSRPGILHTHGGGFVLGSPRFDLRTLQETAAALDCAIVSVDYRLAPGTPYTGSIADNYAGLTWLHGHDEELGVDRKRIAVMGESAGGGHAALLAIAARDRGEIPLAFQLLVYPMLDDRTGSTRQVASHIGTLGWTAEANRFGWRSFLGQEPGGPSVPAAAVPARAADLRGLPPAFIGVGGIDLFVDEDIEYARRLNDAGVATELLVVPGAFHGFDGMAADTTPAKAFNAAKRAALRRALAASV
jgi:acetyl esterase/lipase